MLDEGDFIQEKKTNANNIEISVQVRRDNGEQLKDVIFLGSGEKPKPEYRSFVYYHSNSPRWSELIRLSVPTEIIEKVHVYFNTRHCSSSETKEKPGFSNAYMKITNLDGSVIQDGVHTVECFKPPKTGDPSNYMKEMGGKPVLRKGEHIKVKTVLASSKLTQNSAMLSLLKWRTFTGDWAQVLNQFTYVDKTDVIKFSQETFDALFGVLDAHANVAPLVYNAIVFIIGTLVDDKKNFSSFRPILDSYILNKFAGTTAHKHLMSCLKQYIDEIQQSSSKISKLIPTLKSMEYIFKFIIQSRVLFNKKQASREDIWFKKDLLDVLGGFNMLMKKKSPEFVGAQTLALKNFTSMFQDLGQIFDIRELSDIACKFIESVQYSDSLKLLNLEKLSLIQKLISAELFLNEDSRRLLLPIITKQMRQHIVSPSHDEIAQCSVILSEIVDSMQRMPIPGPTLAELLSLMPELTAAVLQLKTMDEARSNFIVSLLGIFYFMEPQTFAQYVESMSGDRPQLDFLLTTLQLLHMFVSTRTFPENWFVLVMFQYSTVKKMITAISKILKRKSTIFHSTTDREGVEYQTFSQFFQLCIIFVRANPLALENFAETKQQLIRESFGDMRTEVAAILTELWNSLEKYQIYFVNQTVGPLLELMLTNQKDLKEMAVNMYFRLLVSNFSMEKSFSRVESQTVDRLDKMANEGLPLTSLREFFHSSLESRFSGQDETSTKGRAYLNDIDRLLQLLINLGKFPEDKAHQDERITAMLNLMEYLKATGRSWIYVNYVHLLCEEHISANNYAEAGLTLLLHSDLLEWNEDPMNEIRDFEMPAETSWQRKERLLSAAIEYLDKGKVWEKAIDLIRELRDQFETVIFDYQKLADILQQEASLFKRIATSERYSPIYFRVAFYGKGFDTELSGKEFIYRGFELERLSDFTTRITEKYPNATALTTTEPPGPEIAENPGQFIQIFAVKPSSREEKEGKERQSNKNLPLNVQKFNSENNVNVFCYQRPFRKAKTGPEFRDLWLMNTYYVTKNTFPSIHRASPIIEKSESEVHPIDNAIHAVQAKNKEILEIITKYELGSRENISPFTMVLKGVVDAAVNGGFRLYRDAFLVPDYLLKEPEKKPGVFKLKESLRDQFETLEKGLVIHGRLCPEDMMSLQNQLEECFVKSKADIQKDIAIS
eukprot:TRINITY_DN3977_c0_g1_i2.p1 TRINITY_DN3977_c0_g1~~TRINITY_DN3977_c0_g1_i2.p1  ORF type:complete len:1173 (+),score=379.10 TRINITY_DN3977_c0_g1_i2:1536-5054(+)